MDSLPAELVSFVAVHLQQLDVAKQPFSHITETSKDGTIGWLTHTLPSRRDICNFRLVCRAFRNISLCAFGEVLGDRVFRQTKVGLEDLQALSKHVTLRPYIHTLTFGNARFRDLSWHDVDRISLIERILNTLPALESKRLHTAYSDASQWQVHHKHDDYVKAVAAVLSNLPKLKSLRLLTSDYPGMHSHLGGWLSPGDGTLIAQAMRLNSPDMDFQESLYSLNPGSLYPLLSLIPAIAETNVSIEELRIGCGFGVDPHSLHFWLLTEGIEGTLRHLRMDIDPKDLGNDSYNCFHDQALSSLFDLSSLSLSLVHAASFFRFEQATTRLLELLGWLVQLDELIIRGEWSYNEDELLSLIDGCKKLKRLVLKGPILSNGSWASVVRRVLSTGPLELQHLQLSAMNVREDSTRLAPAFEGASWHDFIEDIRPSIEEHGKCTVYLSSGDFEYTFCPASLTN